MIKVMIIIKKSIVIERKRPLSLKKIDFPESAEIIHGIPKQSCRLII